MVRKCVICGKAFEIIPKIRGQATRKTCSPECQKELRHINKLKANQAYRDRNKEKLNAEGRKRYNKDPKKQNKRVRECYQKIKNEIITLLGSKCVYCGFSDLRAIEIDHVNGGGHKERKKFHIYGYYKHILEQVKAGSKDYQLLCSNCNDIKRYEQQHIPD